MISIASAAWSLTGPIVVQNTSQCKLEDHVARVSRHATLDGGAVIVHGGVSDGDRIMRVNIKLSESDEAEFKVLFASSTGVVVSVPDGVFYGALYTMQRKKGRVSTTILIKEKESA